MTIGRDMLMEYVTGTLSPSKEQEVVAHLREHPADAAWVRAMFETRSALEAEQGPGPVPREAQRTLLERIQEKADELARNQPDPPAEDEPVRQPPRRARWAPWLGVSLAAAVALAAWLGLGPAYQNYATARQLDSACSEEGSSCVPLLSPTDEPLGTLARRSSGDLLVVLQAPPPSDQVYQAWLIANAAPRSLGTWSERVLTIEGPSEAQSLLAVSVEPAGGSAQPTIGPIFIAPLDN